jgi:hypothetical protein
MDNSAEETDPPLPVEIVEALRAAGYAPKLAALMSIIDEFVKAKTKAQGSRANPEPEQVFPLKAILPLHVRYLTAARAAKSGQLDAEKCGGQWRCSARAMNAWLEKTGRDNR